MEEMPITPMNTKGLTGEVSSLLVSPWFPVAGRLPITAKSAHN